MISENESVPDFWEVHEDLIETNWKTAPASPTTPRLPAKTASQGGFWEISRNILNPDFAFFQHIGPRTGKQDIQGRRLLSFLS
jgi:hypothetical protein